MTRNLVAAIVVTLPTFALGGCELDQRWVDRHDARVRQAAEASWCDTGQRPRTGLTAIAASRAEACRNTSDRRVHAARGLARHPNRVQRPRSLASAPAAPAGDPGKAPARPADEVTEAASRTTIPVEVDQSVAMRCLAACPAPSDPGTSDELASYRAAICHPTCMVKNLPADSPNRARYEGEAERDLDAIRRLHADGRP